MLKRKPVRVQVTCNCSAYNFPHRISGGKCYGDEWAQSYIIYDGSACQNCALFDGHTRTCDVSDGREEITHCEAYEEHLRTQPSTRFPVHEEDELISMYDYYEKW